jgi:hypothetical protein
MLGSLLAGRISWRNYYFEGRKFLEGSVEAMEGGYFKM